MESNDANRSRVAFVFRGSVLFILPGIYADIVYISSQFDEGGRVMEVLYGSSPLVI